MTFLRFRLQDIPTLKFSPPRFNLGLLIPRLFNLEILTPDSHGVETFMAEWSRVEMSGVEIYTL